ncbi:MAG: hypothetical protein ACK4NC_07450, partial [Candidatus Gracilibacteria bacterium]
ITIPSSAFKVGEVWHSVVIFLKKSNSNFYPIYEHFLFDPTNYLQWDNPSRLAAVSVELNKDSHFEQNINVNDIDTAPIQDWLNGRLVKISNSYYAVYKAPYLRFNTQTLVRQDNQAAFAYVPYGEFNPYLNGIRADESINNIFSLPLYQRPVLYEPLYTGNGSLGFPQYFILANLTEEPLPSGTRIIFNFYIGDEDYSSDLAPLFYCRNVGFVDLNTFDLDITDGVSLSPMPDLNIERRCLDEASNVVLSRQLPPNYGILLQVYPKYHKYQLPVTIPTFYDLKIEPYFNLHLSKYTDLGEVFGDFILDRDGRRLIVPDLNGLKIKSGSGLVKSYYFRQVAESILPPLVWQGDTSRVYLDINGTPVSYGIPPTTTDNEALSLRAVIKKIEGYTQPILVGTFSNWSDTFTFSFNPPTKVRANYPLIGDESARYSGKFAIIVKRGSDWKYSIYQASFNNVGASFTFNFNISTSVSGLSALQIINDPLFGFYDISSCVSDFTSSSGGHTYEVYIAEYYDGSVPSYIDQREISGCIPILKGTIQTFISALADIQPPVETISDLRALGSNLNPIPPYQQRVVLRPKPVKYIFYPDSINDDDGYLYVKPNYVSTTSSGRWRGLLAETSRGYAHLYQVTNLTVTSGRIKYLNSQNKIIVHKTTFESVN